MVVKAGAMALDNSNDAGIDFFGDNGGGVGTVDTEISTHQVPSMSDFDGEDLLGSGTEQGDETPEAETAEGDTKTEEAKAEEKPSEETQVGAGEIEVEAFKRQHKFKLDANDPELRRTLRAGIKAQKLRQQLQETSTKLADTERQRAAERSKVDLVSEIEEGLKNPSRASYDRIVKAVLGNDHYNAYQREVQGEAEEFAFANDKTRAQLEEARRQRERDNDEYYRSREYKRKEDELNALKDRISEDRVTNVLTPLYHRYKFDDFVENKAAAIEKQNLLWDTATSRLAAMNLQSENDLTPDMANKVFKQVYRVMTAGLSKTAKQEAADTDKTAQEAKTTAATIATKQYAGKRPEEKDRFKDWNGDPFDLLKRFK